MGHVAIIEHTYLYTTLEDLKGILLESCVIHGYFASLEMSYKK